MNTPRETMMPTPSRGRSGAATAPRRPSLLGTYPIPELHLVGAPLRDNPRSPIQWQPTAPPLQYGIDYTFLHRTGREPVRWPHGSVITVRITRPATPAMHTALAAVVAELRALTQLDLVIGEPVPASLIHPPIPAGEIHVRYLTASKLAGLAGPHSSRAGLGGASRCPASCCYITGFAFINAGHAGPDATTGLALAILRHELAHALGLGHAARPSLLMHRQLAASTTQYGRGDQHGLMLLGQRLPSQPAGPGHCQQDTEICDAMSQARDSAPGQPLNSHPGNPPRLKCSASPGG